MKGQVKRVIDTTWLRQTPYLYDDVFWGFFLVFFFLPLVSEHPHSCRA